MMTTVSALAMTFWLEESGALQLIGVAGSVHAGTITVTQTRSDLGVAPERHTFQVTGWSGFDTSAPSGDFDARLHDFDYLWDFDDPGATFAPSRLPSYMADANVSYGADVAHVYGPGTSYAPSCLVIERSSGKTALWTATPFDVADPDTFFSGNTITVDPDGGADHTTLAAALDAVNGQATPKRITIARGKTVTVSSSYGLNTGDVQYWPNVYICSASGAGAKATIDFTATSGALFNTGRAMYRQNDADKIDFVLSDLIISGPWDATTESGLTTISHHLYDGLETEARPDKLGHPEYMHIDSCDISGFASAFSFQRNGGYTPSFSMHNCTGTDWSDYMVFGEPNGIYMLGNEIAQPSTAISGGTKDGKHNNHGPVRLGNPAIQVFEGNDFTSLTGWFQNTTGLNTYQPCLRTMGAYQGITGAERLNIRRNLLEGGDGLIVVTDQNNAGPALSINAVIAQNILIASHMIINAFLKIQWGGVTVENNIALMPASANLATSVYTLRALINFSPTSLTTAYDVERVMARHNTMYIMRTTAQGVFGTPSIFRDEASIAQNGMLEEHNIIHAPNIATPITTFAPLTFASTITPKVTGYQRRREVFTGTLSGNVANGASFTVNYADGDFGDGGASSWETGGAHTNSLGTSTFSFGASSATITNASGGTWTSGTAYTVQLERNAANLPAFDTSVATPSTHLGLVTPATGSAAIGGAATTYPKFDIAGTNRITTIGALTRTAATDGAVEVALES